MADEHQNNVVPPNPQANASGTGTPDPAMAVRNAVQHQRGMQMQRLDRWIKYVQQPAFAEIDFYQAQTRIERGEQLMEQMEAIQLRMMEVAAADVDPVAAYGFSFMELEEQYLTAKSRFVRRLAELKPANEQPGTVEGAAAAQLQRINVQLAPAPNQIHNTWGNFDGSLLQWKEFKERYIAQCHGNENIDPVFKFSHLKKSLSGEPADGIKGYQVNAENYTAAWNSLVEKYDRKYPLAREYLRQFFSLTAISTPATAEELRRLSNVTMETVRNLGSLGPVAHDHRASSAWIVE